MTRPRPRRVLVVDDDDASVQLIRTILSSDDQIEIVGRVRHGREALTMAAAANPDVILMELQMPVMDGVESTRLLRAAGSGARIVIVSGSDLPAEIAAAERAGADGYLPKPPNREALLQAILADDRRGRGPELPSSRFSGLR